MILKVFLFLGIIYGVFSFALALKNKDRDKSQIAISFVVIACCSIGFVRLMFFS